MWGDSLDYDNKVLFRYSTCGSSYPVISETGINSIDLFSLSSAVAGIKYICPVCVL